VAAKSRVNGASAIRLDATLRAMMPWISKGKMVDKSRN
jgi:hypothetical protein